MKYPPAADTKDYFVSLTVRNNAKAREQTGHSAWWLKSFRIRAASLTDARACAIAHIESWDYEYGELQILWDDSPVMIAPRSTPDVVLQEAL